MQGTGNDFLLVDGVRQDLGAIDFGKLSPRLCHRRFGIGADQVLLLLPSEIADFRMRIFNADGSEVQMCGNGIRCLARYIWDRGLSARDKLDIETLAGIIRPMRSGEMVKVDMGVPEFEAARIPVALQGRVVDHPLRLEDAVFPITCVSMGNPHAVIFVEDVEGFPVSRYGPAIENHPVFPERTNVEFVQVLNKNEIMMRVWERGAGETLACGTGASAAVVASAVKGLTGTSVTVKLLGGELVIEWEKDGSGRLFMTGAAEEIFEGEMRI
jgi:diaminopimelate epimerase